MRDEDGQQAKEAFFEDVSSGAHSLRVVSRAQEWAKDRGEAFICFVGSMLTPGEFGKDAAARSFRSQSHAQEYARCLLDSGWPRQSIKIKRIKV